MASQITCFDIGEMSLKMVHFSGSNIKKTVVADMPDNMISDGQIISADAFVQFLYETAKANGIPRKEAALIIPASNVHVRTAVVPAMSESQLRYNLPFEFKDYLAADKSKYIFDYEVMDTIKDDDGNVIELKLFACAALKDAVARYSGMLSKAGFRLTRLVPEEYVYSKLCRGDAGTAPPQGESVAIIDLGHSDTRIHILRDGKYDSKRVIEIGIKELETIIAEVTFSDIYMAHSYKRTNHDNVLNSEKCLELYNRVSIEILKSVNFYNFNNRNQELKDIYLIGGGAAIEPLVSTIKEMTGLEVHTAQELLRPTYSVEEPWLFLRSVCCGAKEK